ncbi:LacI family DNA-binding transcriptional regulator [Aurantimonas sp. MSK8Z-1]|uniref:LacI family DNA-binding transcriptional regulator n=1 Tax=Mangrovibrevibacter kandeliae TaxID=2968473 RepID=UPI0021189A83|nr:LacI family DNA-binding transcriptional regulator [Aurantimonas sp. MSK8Z-1]MCW4116827.1 LacI family DNA-binding transcriptional regulator [Aurantimonas sp. MSK8Z-1]
MSDDSDRARTGGYVSAQQVARRAGVSRSAVSRAFTPGASIGKETRDRVLQAAQELGYQVNDLARGLLAKRSTIVGLVGTKPEAGFRAHLVAALAKALIARGSVPVLVNTGDTPPEVEAAQRILLGYRAEATIVMSGSPPAPLIADARRNGQPVVLIGRSDPEVDGILVDNAACAARAATHLAQRGAKRLGLLGSASCTQSIVERETAFRKAAAGLGLEVVTARGTDTDYAGGRQAMAELLAGPRPDAVFCVNDLLALGAVDAVRIGAGLRVPEDVAIIGFDDIPEASWDAYRLTTFAQPPEFVAAEAVRLLDRRRADPHAAPLTLRIDADLRLRATA